MKKAKVVMTKRYKDKITKNTYYIAHWVQQKRFYVNGFAEK